jgi:hypothetical protein
VVEKALANSSGGERWQKRSGQHGGLTASLTFNPLFPYRCWEKKKEKAQFNVKGSYRKGRPGGRFGPGKRGLGIVACRDAAVGRIGKEGALGFAKGTAHWGVYTLSTRETRQNRHKRERRRNDRKSRDSDRNLKRGQEHGTKLTGNEPLARYEGT